MPNTKLIDDALRIAAEQLHRDNMDAQPIDATRAEVLTLCNAVRDLAAMAAPPLPQPRANPLGINLPDSALIHGNGPCNHLIHIPDVLLTDIHLVVQADLAYAGSWKRRGGTAAFHMLARKWDRMDTRLEPIDYNIFTGIRTDTRREGVIDDVRDLRRYLALVEAESIRRGDVQLQTITKESTS